MSGSPTRIDSTLPSCVTSRSVGAPLGLVTFTSSIATTRSYDSSMVVSELAGVNGSVTG